MVCQTYNAKYLVELCGATSYRLHAKQELEVAHDTVHRLFRVILQKNGRKKEGGLSPPYQYCRGHWAGTSAHASDWRERLPQNKPAVQK